MPEPSIGKRIAAYRRRRGLSQAAVAGLVGRSESWLSQVERGLRDVDSYPVLRELARVLRVDLDALTGLPMTPGQILSGGPDTRLAAVERALLVGSIGGAGPDRGDDLWPAVTAAHADYQDARDDEVLDRLPELVTALDAQPSPDVVAAGYTVTAKTLTKIGAFDLALLAADRARAAASRSGDPADLGMALYQAVCALLPTPRGALAEELASAAADRLDGDDGAAVLSVPGALWLIAAVAAARRGDGRSAGTRLARAERQADRLGADANHRWTAFGPTNVRIHRVSVAVELGDAPGALDAARGIDLEQLPRGLRSRRVQVQLDLAWAQAQRRRDTDALVALLEVERAAPQVTRHSVVARDVIRQLLGRARGATAPTVHALAERAGVAI